MLAVAAVALPSRPRFFLERLVFRELRLFRAKCLVIISGLACNISPTFSLRV